MVQLFFPPDSDTVKEVKVSRLNKKKCFCLSNIADQNLNNLDDDLWASYANSNLKIFNTKLILQQIL